MYWITIELVYISSFKSARDSHKRIRERRSKERKKLDRGVVEMWNITRKNNSEKFHRGKFKLLFMIVQHTQEGSLGKGFDNVKAPHCAVTIIINCCQHSIRTRVRLLYAGSRPNMSRNTIEFISIFFHNHCVVNCVLFRNQMILQNFEGTRGKDCARTSAIKGEIFLFLFYEFL